MTFLLDKRRAAVAALVALLGATALVVGAGAASAGDCTDGDFGDLTFGVSPLFFVGVDQEDPGTPSSVSGAWACAIPPDWGAGVGFRDANTGTPGYQVEAAMCVSVTGCTWLVQDTGAEVDASAIGPNEPGGGDGTGGEIVVPENCLYVDGTSSCEPSEPVVTVTVAEGDLPQTHTESGCVDVNGTCQVPTVSGANVTLRGDTANETIYVDAGVAGFSDDGAPTCVGINDPCPS
jgi:hypothetical protein